MSGAKTMKMDRGKYERVTAELYCTLAEVIEPDLATLRSIQSLSITESDNYWLDKVGFIAGVIVRPLNFIIKLYRCYKSS